MARIQLENIKKNFGKVQALDGISFEVQDKEFFVLFGPAGAGKTTILNCIAGLNMPEEGFVKFDDEIMNLKDPAHRNVAMVFENYALYPQMTVYDNMASALRSKLYKQDEEEIKKKNSVGCQNHEDGTFIGTSSQPAFQRPKTESSYGTCFGTKAKCVFNG